MNRLFYLLPILAWSCNTGGGGGNAPKEMEYSFACLDSNTVSGSPLSKKIGKAGDFLRELAVDESEITDELQNEYGAAFHKDAIESKTFRLLQDGAITGILQTAMQELLAMRQNPSRIKYEIYALEDTVINAFTFGGRIYVTRAMYNKCKDSKALLYAIIGHEIGHSEMGHIKRTIQEMMVSNKIFGEESGTTVFQIKRLLTGSFNQKNELEADYYGTDLTYRLDQDVCAAVAFWREMSEAENPYSQLEDFFRTHPFSDLRARCLEAHIQTNFNRTCGAIKAG